MQYFHYAIMTMTAQIAIMDIHNANMDIHKLSKIIDIHNRIMDNCN